MKIVPGDCPTALLILDLIINCGGRKQKQNILIFFLLYIYILLCSLINLVSMVTVIISLYMVDLSNLHQSCNNG